MFYELTNREFEIMTIFWENEDGVSFGEVHAYVNELGKKLKRQSVNTYIQNLIAKGYVRAEGEERHKLYYPALKQQEYNSIMAKQMVNQLFGGSLKKFIVAFSKEGLTEKEVQELKALLRREK